MLLRSGREKIQADMSGQNTANTANEDPAWLKQLTERLDNIERSVKAAEAIPTIQTSLKNLNDKFDKITKQMKVDSDKMEKLEQNVIVLENRNLALKKELQVTQDKLQYLESQTRRNNIVITGIKEMPNESWKQTEEMVYKLFEDTMKIDGARNIIIERAHRIYRGDKDNRAIVVKFLNFKDKENILQKTSMLQKSIRIFEDYPLEIQKNRQKLWPIYKHAKGLKDFTKVQLKLDKLFINGKLFTTQNLHELPPALQPENRAVKYTDDVVVFYSQNSVFSNFNASEVKIEGETYCCNEQYFQYIKAHFFGDETTAEKIKEETNPYKINSLGKQVKGYRKEVWERKAFDVLKRVNSAKYSQNPNAKKTLLETGNRKIGEATPDLLYGTGVPISRPEAADTETWTGKNLMGQILTEIRSELQEMDSLMF